MAHKDVSLEKATQVQERYTDDLMEKENVVGVGVGLRKVRGEQTNEICIVVMVTHKVPLAKLKPEDRVPPVIDGVHVDVQETGEFSAGSSY
jgi:hypothetical protein